MMVMLRAHHQMKMVINVVTPIFFIYTPNLLKRFFYSFLVMVDSVPSNPVAQLAAQNVQAVESIIVMKDDTKDATDGDAKRKLEDITGKCWVIPISFYL